MLSPGAPTVWINAAEVLAALSVSPLYRAVIEWLPTLSEDVVRDAVPRVSAAVHPIRLLIELKKHQLSCVNGRSKRTCKA